jgi:hypothetical protein
MGDMTDNKRNKDYDSYYNKHRRRELTAEEKERRKEYNTDCIERGKKLKDVSTSAIATII